MTDESPCRERESVRPAPAPRSTRYRRRLVLLLAAIVVCTGAQARAAGDYLLATASTGGTYYPVGVALATLVKVRLLATHGINLSAINSAGSGENIKLLRDNEVQFAILQGLYGAYAWQGTGPLEQAGAQRDLRSVSMLWQNVEHFVVDTSAVQTGTVADLESLRGRNAGFGKRNSGSLGSSRHILSHLGLDPERDFDLYFGGYGALAEAFQDGRIAVMNTPAGVPVGALTKVFAARSGDATLLSFTADQAARADGGLGLWSPYIIPAGTYPGQDEDIPTIAQPNFLAVRSDIADDDVYRITQAIYENLGFLRAIHKATNAMAVEQAITGLPLPLHPGAARYYREAGLEIPERMLPN